MCRILEIFSHLYYCIESSQKLTILLDQETTKEIPQMALTNTGTENVQTAAVAPQQHAAPQSRPLHVPNVPGTAGMNSNFVRTGRSDGIDARATKALTAFEEARNDAISQQALKDDFQLIRFDRAANQVAMASILIVKKVVVSNQASLVVKALLIVDNGAVIKPKTVRLPNGFGGFDDISRKPYADEIFSASYWNRVQTSLTKQTGVERVINAGPQEIHGHYDYDDKSAVRDLLIKAVNSADEIVAQLYHETPFSLTTHVKTDAEVLVASIDVSDDRPQLVSNTGVPIRSDLLITQKRVRKDQHGQHQQENEFYEADEQLSTVAAFMNLEYVPSEPVRDGYGQVIAPAKPPFLASVVITAVRQANWIMANTPEMYFHALANAYRVTDNHAWAKAFLPSVGREKDPRDIGATGYLIKGAKEETKSETFSPEDFAGLMNTTVQKDPAFMLDLDRCGDNSYIESMILDSMSGHGEARTAVITVLQNLYGRDNFNKAFDVENEWLFKPYGTDFRLGSYAGENGELRDRRDLDTLYGLNACDGIEAEFMDFYGSVCNLELHPEARQRKADTYDKRYLGTVNYAGRVTRVIANPKLMLAMDVCAQRAGVSVSTENVQSVFGGQRFTGNSQLAGMGVASTYAHAPQGGTQYQANYAATPGMIYQ
jgi:hypothetical protein